jgi:sarcosine oxidase
MFRFGAGAGDAFGAGDGDRLEGMHHAASTVNADLALTTLRSRAEARGAMFFSGSRVDAIDVVGDERVIVHHHGGKVEATTCVIATGGWAGEQWVRSAIGADAHLPELTVTQEQVAFFRPTSSSAWPTFVARTDPCVYGLPTPEGLVKVGEHHTGPIIDIEQRSHELEPLTWQRLQDWVAAHLPGVEPTPVRSTTCLYASYPGDTFLFDRIGPVVLGLGLSGHGFKFVPEVGRLLADLADRVVDDVNSFGLDRPMIDIGRSGRR